MNKNYIVNGQVERQKIAIDIKLCKLNRSDIEELANNPLIKKEFFGKGFSNKKPRSEWNKNYLDLLVCAVVSESFNREYLLYLNEVADFVSKAKFKRVIINGVIIILVIIAGVIVYTYFLNGGK